MGHRLLATPARWATGTALTAGLALPLARALAGAPALGAMGERSAWMVAACAAASASAALFLYLRGEEARLTRELRVARSGTAVQRRTLLRRRRPAPYFGLAMFWYAAVRVLAALASTTLGYAAVLLAEGEIDQADAALHGLAQALSVGPLRALRAIVLADLRRARGTAESLEAAIKALYAMPALEHREAERYRLHVLVKALLEQGDEATARAVAEELKDSADQEVRVYVVWLRAWFEWAASSGVDEPSEADLRLALLLARTHGAVDLVARLDARLRLLPDAAPPAAAVALGGVDGVDPS